MPNTIEALRPFSIACSRFSSAGGATNFNHVKNQSPGHAKKVECSSTYMACPRAFRRTKNAQVRQLQRKLSNVRSARADKATAIMENGLYDVGRLRDDDGCSYNEMHDI